MKKLVSLILALTVLGSMCMTVSADVEGAVVAEDFADAEIVVGSGPDAATAPNQVVLRKGDLAIGGEVVEFEGGKAIQLTVSPDNAAGNNFSLYVPSAVTDFTQRDLLRIRIKNSSDKEAYGIWLNFGNLSGSGDVESNVAGCITLINKDGSANNWNGKFWGDSPTLPANFDGYILVDMTKMNNYSADALKNVTGRLNLQFMKGDGPVMAGVSITVGDLVLVSRDAVVPSPGEDEGEGEDTPPVQVDPDAEVPVQSFVGATIVEDREPTEDDGENPVSVYTEGPEITASIVDFDGGKGIDLTVAAGNTNEGAFKLYVYHPGVTDFTRQDLLRIRVKNNSEKEAYGLWVSFGDLGSGDVHSSAAGCVTLINKDGSANDWTGQFWGTSPTLPANFDGYILVDLTKMVNYSAESLKNVTGRLNLQFMKGDGPVMAGTSITIGDIVLVNGDNPVPENPDTGSTTCVAAVAVMAVAAGGMAMFTRKKKSC